MTIGAIKHAGVNVMCLFVPTRQLRRRFRRAAMHFHICDFAESRRFARESVRPNAVLLIEPNVEHGEVTAGYLRYFQELGLSVDCLVNSAILKENPFCRLDLSDVRVFVSDYPMMRRFFASRKFQGYEHVVLMSSAIYSRRENGTYTSALEYYPTLRKHRSLFVVEHDLDDVGRFGERDLLAEGRLLTLGRFDRGVFAAPILFGSVDVTPRVGDVTTFVCVGGIERERKNHAELVAAIRAVAARRTDFKVVVVGKGELESLPEDVRPYVEVTGRLDFPAMFGRMEEADFYLPLLDAAYPAHDRYVTTGVTGSAQLVYAFGKVPVVHPKFAPFYGFDEGDAVVSESLADGMLAAVAMEREDYHKRQTALVALAGRLKEKSLENLKRALGGGLP